MNPRSTASVQENNEAFEIIDSLGEPVETVAVWDSLEYGILNLREVCILLLEFTCFYLFTFLLSDRVVRMFAFLPFRSPVLSRRTKFTAPFEKCLKPCS